MKKFVLFLILFSLHFSCKKDEVVPTDDNELITTVDLTFTDSNKKVSTFSFQDKDGDAKTPPEKFDKIVLEKRYGITNCCPDDDEKWLVLKELIDLQALKDPNYICPDCPCTCNSGKSYSSCNCGN